MGVQSESAWGVERTPGNEIGRDKAMRSGLSLGIVLSLAASAQAGMEITEWMYSGANGEFIEFTNVGPTPIDMTGWSYDDDSRTPGTVPLSAYGVVQPGESVILTEASETAFRTAWGLAASVKVIGGLTANLGRADEINLYDASNALVDRLTYDDQTGKGPRTQYKSCNIPAVDYGLTTASGSWPLASVGDAYGSWRSTGNDTGSPGRVPEPATLAFLAAGGLLAIRRHDRD